MNRFREPTRPWTINFDSSQAKNLLFWFPCFGEKIRGNNLSECNAVVDLVQKQVLNESTSRPTVGIRGDKYLPCIVSTTGNFLRKPLIGANVVPPFTMMGWAYADDDFNYYPLITLENSTFGSLHYYSILGRYNDTFATAETYDGTSTLQVDASGVPAAGVWEHFVGLFGTGSDSKCYLDGTGGSAGTLGNPSVNGRITLGRIQHRNVSFKGGLADIRIYNGLLTDAEITDCYDRPWDLMYELKRKRVFELPGIHEFMKKHEEINQDSEVVSYG